MARLLIARFVFATAALLVTVNVLEAQTSNDGPFGLRWLDSKDEVVGSGVQLTPFPLQDFGATFVATHLPKALADQDTTYLSFGYDDKLIRVATIGRAFSSDHYGTTAKSRYDELCKVLQAKYGVGKSLDHIDEDYSGDKFSTGLLSNRNWMLTHFETGTMRVEVAVVSFEYGITRWRLVFEHSVGMDDLRKQKEEKEKDTL